MWKSWIDFKETMVIYWETTGWDLQRSVTRIDICNDLSVIIGVFVMIVRHKGMTIRDKAGMLEL